jgi:hypothetical protein
MTGSLAMALLAAADSRAGSLHPPQQDAGVQQQAHADTSARSESNRLSCLSGRSFPACFPPNAAMTSSGRSSEVVVDHDLSLQPPTLSWQRGVIS